MAQFGVLATAGRHRPRPLLSRLPATGLALVLAASGCATGSPVEPIESVTTLASVSTTSPPTSTTSVDAEPAGCPPPGDSPGAEGVGDPVFTDLGNGGYDVSHYDLSATIDPARHHLEATAVVEATANQPLTSFHLDFFGPEIRDVAVDGEPARFCREEGELLVAPEAAIGRGEEFRVTVAYAGSPTGVARARAPLLEGWERLSDEQVTAGGLWGAQAVFMPVNATDQDKATYRMEITVPHPLAVVATGELVEVTEGEKWNTYRWVSDVPTPSSRRFVATGRFELEESEGPDGIRFQHLLPPDTDLRLGEDLERATPILEALADRLGPFPFRTFGFASVTESPAATVISAQTRVVLLGIDRVGDRDLAHELGHQWFGNSLTPATTQDDWLSEGFATYTEVLWMEVNLGPDHRDDLPASWLSHLGDATRPLAVVESPDQLADTATYFRGGATLHALRYEVGEETFFSILRAYADEFQHSPVTTDDFIGVAEAEAGRDLSQFFQDWLYREEVPPIPGMGG